jgi:hypothetical protein
MNEELKIGNPTIIDWFIHENKGKPTIVGDLCWDIRQDPAYPVGTSIEHQLVYIQTLANQYPQIMDAIEEFLKQLQQYQRIVI